ncbi:hypothetical protein TURU_080956 [Turdus rufiventris]|nr:hypothetical protein TURU_080956 [Turdus rufiventris]
MKDLNVVIAMEVKFKPAVGPKPWKTRNSGRSRMYELRTGYWILGRREMELGAHVRVSLPGGENKGQESFRGYAEVEESKMPEGEELFKLK